MEQKNNFNLGVRSRLSLRLKCRRCGKATQHEASLLLRWRCTECGEVYSPWRGGG